MAVRSNTDGKLTRATDLPVNDNGWTMTRWSLISATEAAYRVVMGVQGAAGIYDYLLLEPSSAVMRWEHNAGGAFSASNIFTMSLDTWYFAAIRMISGTQVEILWRALHDEALSSSGVLTIANTPTPTWTDLYQMGSSVAGEEWSNGRADCFKFWQATLSAAEIMAESLSGPPVRTSNLDSYLPLATAASAGTSQSGSGGNWTVTGTLETVDGPDIDWPSRRKRRRHIIDVAVPEEITRLRRLALGAFGAVPLAIPGGRRRPVRDDALVDLAPLRRDLSFAAVAQGAPVGLPWARPRRTVSNVALRELAGLDAALRREFPLAALEEPPPPGPSTSARRRIDVRRNRARFR